MAAGEIRNRKRFKQVVNFKELTYGKISPTDIDGFIDFQDKLFIIIELKLVGIGLETGQRLAFERLNDNLEKAGKHSVVLIAEHNVTNCDDDIDVYKCEVVMYRLHKTWRDQESYQKQNLVWPHCNVKVWIDTFIRKYL